jgi:hypothetical protein
VEDGMQPSHIGNAIYDVDGPGFLGRELRELKSEGRPRPQIRRVISTGRCDTWERSTAKGYGPNGGNGGNGSVPGAVTAPRPTSPDFVGTASVSCSRQCPRGVPFPTASSGLVESGGSAAGRAPFNQCCHPFHRYLMLLRRGRNACTAWHVPGKCCNDPLRPPTHSRH